MKWEKYWKQEKNRTTEKGHIKNKRQNEIHETFKTSKRGNDKK